MISTRALCFHEFGRPSDVLRLEERSVNEPGPGEALLRLVYAPINPSDIGVILGKYGKLPQLPAVAGREGLGEVLAVGDGVSAVRIGDRVRWPEGVGSWQSRCVAKADGLTVVPHDIPAEIAAMAWINPPTAWRILRDAHLRPGDWIIQNAANSAVGIFVIQIAQHLGFKTINVVRRAELKEPLLELGADIVVLEQDEAYPKSVPDLTSGGSVRLALNSVGGPSVLRLIDSLSAGGKVVTFGAMDFSPVRFPTRQLIFSDVHLSGFWLDRWLREHSAQRIQIMMNNLFSLMREGVIRAPIEATFPFEHFHAALDTNSKPRLGKVLLRGDA